MAVNLNPSFTRFPNPCSVARSTRIICSPIKAQFANSQVRLFSPLIPASKLRATSTRISHGRHFSPLIPAPELRPATTRRTSSICCLISSIPEESVDEKDDGLFVQVLKRWDVPWNWQIMSLTTLACLLSYNLPLRAVGAALYYFGIRIPQTSEAMSSGLFLSHGILTTMVLAILFRLTKPFSPLPDEIYQYDWREPFNLKKGWLLWAGIGFGVSVAAMAMTGAAMSFFNITKRENRALMSFLPVFGSSPFSTACMVGCQVIGPILVETFFRGFVMVSLTKWLPTPLSVLLSAALYAVVPVNPAGLDPLLFVQGTAIGFSYAQTRNLLTPITIQALYNTGFVLLLTFLKLKGFDIQEMVQSPSFRWIWYN